jgi:hypothetical protein
MLQILHEYDSCCFSPHGRHDQMKQYEANIRSELSKQSSHGWFTTTADNHTKHEVCAQDKAIIAAALAGSFPPADPQWDTIPCDIIHQPVAQPGRCAQNVEPGGKPKPDPEPSAEPGFKMIGNDGACRDSNGNYPAWGSAKATNSECARVCSDNASCDAYMSTNNGMYCQFYCTSGLGKLCTVKGNGGGAPSTTTHQDQERYCWLKQPKELS